MPQYEGAKCPVCNNEFIKGDDIVVCPECGAPHHRSCYKEHGTCAFSTLHEDGFEWKAPEPAQPANEAEHASDQGPSRTPPVQGEPPEWYMNQTWSTESVPRLHPYGGLAPEDEIEGVSVRDMSHYIGASTGYYIRSFKKMSASKSPISWNWAALFFDFAYFFYRKMYLFGTVLFAITLVTNIATVHQLVTNAPALAHALTVSIDEYISVLQKISQTTSVFDMLSLLHNILRVAGAVFANYLYQREVVSGIHAAREEKTVETGSVAYHSLLAKKGGGNVPLVLVSVAIILISVIAPSFYIAGILLS